MAARTVLSAIRVALLCRVVFCFTQHALVAGAAFAVGVACTEWAAAVLAAGS